MYKITFTEQLLNHKTCSSVSFLLRRTSLRRVLLIISAGFSCRFHRMSHELAVSSRTRSPPCNSSDTKTQTLNLQAHILLNCCTKPVNAIWKEVQTHLKVRKTLYADDTLVYLSVKPEISCLGKHQVCLQDKNKKLPNYLSLIGLNKNLCHVN